MHVATVESPTSLRLIPESRWRNWSFNAAFWQLCECTSNSRFWVFNPLFLTPFHDLSREVFDVPVKFQLFILKAVWIHDEFMFFEWLTLYFRPFGGNGRIVNPSTTCPGESSTFLWSLNSSSWKLCKCTSNSRFRVINPLFSTLRGER